MAEEAGWGVGDVGAPVASCSANETMTADWSVLDARAGVDPCGPEVHVSPDDRVVPM